MQSWIWLLFAHLQAATLLGSLRASASTSRSEGSCQVTIVGSLNSADTVQYASVHCTKGSAVAVTVDPIIQPFASAFTGDDNPAGACCRCWAALHCTTLSHTEYSCTSDAGVNVSAVAAERPSTLISFSANSIPLVNSTFLNLNSTRDSVLLLQTSNFSISNSTFTRNQARVTGGIAAHGLAQASIENCHFSNNLGKSNSAVTMVQCNH